MFNFLLIINIVKSKEINILLFLENLFNNIEFFILEEVKIFVYNLLLLLIKKIVDIFL